jgi:phosphopantetheinyl transferase
VIVQRIGLHYAGEFMAAACAWALGETGSDHLSPAEIAQRESMQFAPKRTAFSNGRLAAKRAIAALLEVEDLRRIEIANGVHGAPYIRIPACGLGVSLSHSGDAAVAIAFPRGAPIGIDLESVGHADALAVLPALQCSPAEQAWRQETGLADDAACALLWSAREALGKALGTGIASPPGVLALGSLAAIDGGWQCGYLNFPRFSCRVQLRGARVLALALPAEVAPDAWPALA